VIVLVEIVDNHLDIWRGKYQGRLIYTDLLVMTATITD